LAAKLRPGNVHSAEDWEELLLPEIERQQKLGKEVVFRADAAFAKPDIYEALEERGVIEHCINNAMISAKKGEALIAGCSREVSRATCRYGRWNG